MRRLFLLPIPRASFRHAAVWGGLALGVLFTPLAGPAEGARVRLAVTCQADGQAAPEIQDRITAALSGDPEIELLERARLDLLIREEAVPHGSARGAQPGRFLPLDFFLNIRRKNAEKASPSGPWVIEAVNAQSGTVVCSTVLKIAPGAALAEALASEAGKLIRRDLAGKLSSSATDPGTARIAVLDFLTEEKGGVEDTASALRMSSDARTFLSAGGVTVLDRALAQQVVRENGYLQEGFVEEKPDRLPLLGADIVALGKISRSGGERNLELTLFDVRKGRTMAAKTFPLPREGAGPLPDAARKWFLENAHASRSLEQTFEESIQVEALEPFYLGIAKFLAGNYLEAAGEFQKAYSLNDKFADAMLWEARCYDALGLKPLADAERRFATVGLVGNGVTGSANAHADAAITFLGITGGIGPGERAAAGKTEMLAIDQLASTAPLRLQLASHLAPLRDEYDLLVGTKNTSGTQWTAAPRFLSDRSLRGEMAGADASGRRSITWYLVESLSGRTLSKTTTELGAAPGQWREEIRPGIAALLKEAAGPVNAELAPPQPLPPVAELEKQVSSRKGIALNTPLLALAIRNPENPKILSKELSKGLPGRNNLDAFLNFGLRESLLEKMPATCPGRPWLQLRQISAFLHYNQAGLYFSGREINGKAALAQFVKDHPDDLAGGVATYMALWDRLSDIEPGALARQLAALEARLQRFGAEDLSNWDNLCKMTHALRVTAQIATGKYPNLPLPTGTFAHRVEIEFDTDGRPRARADWRWRTSEWEILSDSANRAPEEARASLAILGRGDDLRRVDPRWLRDFPQACVLNCYVIDALHEINWPYGRPWFHPFDADAMRKDYRDMTAYAFRNLLHELEAAASVREVSDLEGWVDKFVQNLCENGFSGRLSDEDWEQMRQALAKKMDDANLRVGRNSGSRPDRNPAGWRTMERRSGWRKGKPVRAVDEPRRARFTELERTASLRSWKTSPVEDRQWSDAVHGWLFEQAFTCKELAAIYQAHLPRFNELFPGPDYSFKELAFMLDFGSTLLRGEERAEAESIFCRMLAAEENDLNSFETAREMRANAAIAMALICRASGRKAEAVDYAQRALSMSMKSGKPFHITTRLNANRTGEEVDDAGNLRAVALRILSELRNDPKALQAKLPPRVKSVVVRTPNLSNAEATFYYRVPANYDASRPNPVLVIGPSINHTGLNYCLDNNPWAQFADKNGIFLVVTQFNDLLSSPDGPSTTFQNPNVWSGQATVDAIEKIRALYSIDSEKLLLHGYGGGAQFVLRFARWAPQRCAALSLHSASNWAWRDGEPGFQPLSSLQEVPCLVTTAAEDDFRCCDWNRLATAIQWVTMARGAGVPVIWKTVQGISHNPSPEMEKLSMAFFGQHLNPDKAAPAFTGDLRSSVYYPDGDPRVKEIPGNFRQKLPSRALAKLWGTEGK